MPICKTCGKSFIDYSELASHIRKNKKTHRIGQKWATKYIHVSKLSMKAKNGSFEPRQPLTEEQKEARRECIRELSGDMVTVNAICPKCKAKYRMLIEIEYATSKDALKVNDFFIRLCPDCRK